MVPYALIPALLTPCLGTLGSISMTRVAIFGRFDPLKNSYLSPDVFWCQHFLTLAWGCLTHRLLDAVGCYFVLLLCCNKGFKHVRRDTSGPKPLICTFGQFGSTGNRGVLVTSGQFWHTKCSPYLEPGLGALKHESGVDVDDCLERNIYLQEKLT